MSLRQIGVNAIFLIRLTGKLARFALSQGQVVSLVPLVDNLDRSQGVGRNLFQRLAN